MHGRSWRGRREVSRALALSDGHSDNVEQPVAARTIAFERTLRLGLHRSIELGRVVVGCRDTPSASRLKSSMSTWNRDGQACSSVRFSSTPQNSHVAFVAVQTQRPPGGRPMCRSANVAASFAHDTAMLNGRMAITLCPIGHREHVGTARYLWAWIPWRQISGRTYAMRPCAWSRRRPMSSSNASAPPSDGTTLSPSCGG